MIEKHAVVSLTGGDVDFVNELLDSGAKIVDSWVVGDRLYLHLTMLTPEPDDCDSTE